MSKRRRKGARARVLGAALFLLAVSVPVCLFLAWGTRAVREQTYPLEYADIIEKAAGENDLDETLLRAVIWCESGYRPDAVSPIGARGLMQLTEDTFNWVRWRLDEEEKTTFEDAFDPEVNIKYGAYLLRWLLDTFDGETETALAAYHAGANVVRGWLADPDCSADGKTLDNIPYRDTAQYVPRVLRAQRAYRSRQR